MSLFTRTATLQARVCPEIKFASEDVLRRIGLNLTEAMELFLRRVIIDQKLPFEVAALDHATLTALTTAWQEQAREAKEVVINSEPRRASNKRSDVKRE
jgi:DNA-damage-inducible protein J